MQNIAQRQCHDSLLSHKLKTSTHTMQYEIRHEQKLTCVLRASERLSGRPGARDKRGHRVDALLQLLITRRVDRSTPRVTLHRRRTHRAVMHRTRARKSVVQVLRC